jgi:hypothetical protein
MSRRKRRFPWLAILSIALLAGGGYLITACTPPDSGNDGQMDDSDNMNSNGMSDDDNMSDDSDSNGEETACKQADDEGNEFETDVSTMSAQGKMLTLNRKVITSPDMNDSLRVETEILSDGALVMRIITTDDGMGKIEVNVEYGDEIPGVNEANIFVENGMIGGTIDGRDINEMEADGANAEDTTFADGLPAPSDGASDDLKDALSDLFAKAKTAADNCNADPNVEPNGMNSNGAPDAKILGIPPQDDGHDSDPEATAGCIGCWAGCSTGAAGCIAGVSVACVAATVFYAVCEAAAVAGCAAAYIGCVAGCNSTGAPCCPVSCGSVACCLTEESCLNAQIGLCCDVGKKPCVGENCCAATETCIDSGPNAGICCEPENICGNTCCEPDNCVPEASLCCEDEETPCDDKCCAEGEECIAEGVCCGPPNIKCGDVCCDELANCNESQNTCCGFDQEPCGTGCCAVGEACIGNSCCPDARACGNICCPAGNFCQDDTLTCDACPNATDTPCNVGGCCPAGMTCQDTEGICCLQGELYCNGACRPFGECIQ